MPRRSLRTSDFTAALSRATTTRTKALAAFRKSGVEIAFDPRLGGGRSPIIVQAVLGSRWSVAWTSFRAVLRNLLASREGQLAFDFRIQAPPAKVLQLKRPEPPPMAALMEATPPAESSSAEQYVSAASILDDGDPANFDEAALAYRHALEIDPYLVPALINLANIHYLRDEIAEAQALYERAISLDRDVFEAHFNLGNILHDLGRYPAAQACYRDALRLNPAFADAHFYLAVTLEKSGQSQDARPHWRAYQQLAPNGEWVDLAREFSD